MLSFSCCFLVVPQVPSPLPDGAISPVLIRCPVSSVSNPPRLGLPCALWGFALNCGVLTGALVPSGGPQKRTTISSYTASGLPLEEVCCFAGPALLSTSCFCLTSCHICSFLSTATRIVRCTSRAFLISFQETTKLHKIGKTRNFRRITSPRLGEGARA